MTGAYPRENDSPLGQRIRAAAEVLLDAVPAASTPDHEWADVNELLYAVVADVHRRPTPARIWLLCTAISTVLPDAEDVREAIRTFELATVDEAMHWLMESCLGAALDFGNPTLEVRIVRDAVVVEVDFSARFNLHTGIQRVVRALLPRWNKQHEIVPVAWAPGYGLMRTLAADEADRVLRWHGGRGDEVNRSETSLDTAAWTLVVPWNCVLVLAEVPARDVCERLAGLAEHSGNAVVGIGYDCIPVVSADLVPPAEPNRFVRYLSIVKHMRRIAGISGSATDEFRGFAHSVRAQGLDGPQVVECRLPTEPIGDRRPVDPSPPPADPPSPTILCVGSFEPRKNQIAVLYAAETLWREGHRFQLEFIGGGGWGTAMNRLVKRLDRLGRPVSVRRAVSDADLERAFRSASFSIFASLHEGYGLPVAESLAFGLPVITTEYGSTAEIGAAGGVILIDPRDDDQLIDAMRTLLTDRDVLARLQGETRLLPTRTWEEYSDDLWAQLVVAETAGSVSSS